MPASRISAALLPLLLTALVHCGGDDDGTPSGTPDAGPGDDGSGGGGDGSGGDASTDPGAPDGGPADVTPGTDGGGGGGGGTPDAGGTDGGPAPDGSTTPEVGGGSGGEDAGGEADAGGEDAGNDAAGDDDAGTEEPAPPAGTPVLIFYRAASDIRGPQPPALEVMRWEDGVLQRSAELRPFQEIPGAVPRTGLFFGDVNGDNLDDLAYWAAADRNGPGFLDVSLAEDGGVLSRSGWWPDLTLGVNVPGGAGNGLIGDVNGDGRADLIYWIDPGPGVQGGLRVLRSAGSAFVADGDMGFTPARPTDFMPPRNPWVRVGDFNGDGFDDVFRPGPAVGPDNGGTEMWYGSRTGFASEVETGVSTSWGRVIMPETALLPGDVNGDGFDDLLFVNAANFPARSPGSIGAAFGSAAGLAPPVAWFTGNIETGPVVPPAAQYRLLDVDSDGLPDLVLVTPNNGREPGALGVMRNLGTTFEPSVSVLPPMTGVPRFDVLVSGRL
jgi:hypothetical protein